MAGRRVKVESQNWDERNTEGSEDYFYYIGDYLIRRDVGLPEVVFAKVIIRINQLPPQGEKMKAEKLEEILYHWQGREIEQYVANQILEGTANITTLANALQERDIIAAKHEQDLKKLVQKDGAFAGIAIAILKNLSGIADLLHENDVEAKRAMLGCLRYLRIPIPLNLVSKVLRESDMALVNAAELYLQAIDTLEARNMLLSRAKGSITIVGRFPGYDAGHYSNDSFEEIEKWLIAEMEKNKGLDEIIALLSAGYWGDAGQRIIRISGSRAVFNIHENTAYVLERQLGKRELQQLRNFLQANQVDGLKPLLNPGAHDGMQYEYVHLKRNGGIRVVMNNPGFCSSSEELVYLHLTELFFALEEAGKFQIRYK